MSHNECDVLVMFAIYLIRELYDAQLSIDSEWGNGDGSRAEIPLMGHLAALSDMTGISQEELRKRVFE